MVTHLVIPFEASIDEKEWQLWSGIETLPSTYGRLPTIFQLQEVIESYAAAKYEMRCTEIPNVRWTATLSSDSVYWLLTVDAWMTNESVMHLTAEGDRFHLEEIVKRLPSDCGTLIVVTDGEEPSLIETGRFGT
jgi:hypothetical protein